ncbi:hypothetical protein [Bacillus dakarensis]|uniref:hypothetical protein n=1 Tax=Robertmurraya dakarensis TaxID=1926278 RepID=UPI0009816D84|nr:hypothetical protein [Bacillus dakarensis]
MHQVTKTVQKPKSVSRIERKNYFLKQLHEVLNQKGYKKSECKKVELELKRIINYFMNYTDIKKVTEIKLEHVIKYMKHSIEVSYLELSIKELKNEVILLQFALKGYTREDLSIDLSISNFNLWTQLLPRKSVSGS